MISKPVFERNIIDNAFLADTFKDRFLGYMFRKRPHYAAILITPCNSIHTFFMKFNIDVIFVAEDMTVLRKIENLQPGRIIMPVRGAKAVIEAEAFMFRKINVGQKVIVNHEKE